MNKKLLSAFAVFLMSMSLAVPASAECDGFYMGVRGGIVNHNIGDSNESLGDRLEVDDNAWMAGAALGYRYTYFRAELEFTWREETDKKTGEIDARNNSTFQTMSYMLNIYADLTPYSMFTPYVMAGIGMTNIEYEFQGFGRRAVKYEEAELPMYVKAFVNPETVETFPSAAKRDGTYEMRYRLIACIAPTTSAESISAATALLSANKKSAAANTTDMPKNIAAPFTSFRIDFL